VKVSALRHVQAENWHGPPVPSSTAVPPLAVGNCLFSYVLGVSYLGLVHFPWDLHRNGFPWLNGGTTPPFVLPPTSLPIRLCITNHPPYNCHIYRGNLKLKWLIWLSNEKKPSLNCWSLALHGLKAPWNNWLILTGLGDRLTPEIGCGSSSNPTGKPQSGSRAMKSWVLNILASSKLIQQWER